MNSSEKPAQVVVCKQHGRWHVRCQVLGNREFAKRREAILAAVEAAHSSGKNGRPASVVMVDREDALKLWTYGVDPYPPSMSPAVLDEYDPA